MLRYTLIVSSCLLVACLVFAQNEPLNENVSSLSEADQKVDQQATVHEIFEPLPAGQSVRVVRVGKTLRVPEGESLQSAYVVAGDVLLEGTIHQNLTVVHGSVSMGATAMVKGDLVLFMADASYNPAQVKGEVRQIQSGTLMSGLLSLMTGPPRRESDASSQVLHALTGYRVSWGNVWLLWKLFTFAMIVTLHMFLAAALPTNIEIMSHGFASRPLGSILLGIGVALILIPVVLLTLFSPFGLLFLLCTVMLLVSLAVLGKTALLLILGNAMLQREHVSSSAILVGYLVYSLATSLPYLGLPVFLIINLLSVGLCIRSRLGSSTASARGARRPTSREVRTGWDSPVRGS